MRINTPLLLVPIILSTSVYAQNGSAERDVLAANAAWFDAFVRGDAEAMDRMETDDFVMIQNGQLVNKSEQLDNIRARGGPLDLSYSIELNSFSLNGSTAVATGISTVTFDGGSNGMAFTEVWVSNGREWQVQSAHYSSVNIEEMLDELERLSESE